ncbi:peptidylprolyl isomerase [Flammeovirgaceae bacterium SG7u.111]|nr:peptidylprolyl isomerase [Flammeovirgaceae bacterium SG7u.132]WPO36226.1 peptidylprolyl isomerase [Flammeovirgaceae bacterium SG7u.111]
MIEGNNKVISLTYNLYKDTADGEMIESTEGKEPLVFLTGAGQMIPEFESSVVGLAVGEEFSFGIKSANAYGERSDDAVLDLPQDMFMNEGKMIDEVQVGNILPLQDNQGNVHHARVLSINENTVTMDANHPLAGQDLYFTGSVLEVREATADEISHGHAHGPGGHQH